MKTLKKRVIVNFVCEGSHLDISVITKDGFVSYDEYESSLGFKAVTLKPTASDLRWLLNWLSGKGVRIKRSVREELWDALCTPESKYFDFFPKLRGI